MVVERGPLERTALVSAIATRENGRIYLNQFVSDFELSASEAELAHEELTDRAMAYWDHA